MDWNIFLAALVAGDGLVVIQGIASWVDHYFTQSQMRERRIMNGWSFMEHGGMWADVFLVSPSVAYFVSKYRLDYLSKWGLSALGAIIVVTIVMGRMYQKNAITTPEAHTHDGRTTFAGWVHGLFAVLAMWTFALLYLNLTTPRVSRIDFLVLFSVIATTIWLGVTKFSNRWKLAMSVAWQNTVAIIGLGALTAMRILLT